MAFDELQRPLLGGSVVWSTNDLRKESFNHDEENLIDDKAFLSAQVVCLVSFSKGSGQDIEDKPADDFGSRSPLTRTRGPNLSYSIR